MSEHEAKPTSPQDSGGDTVRTWYRPLGSSVRARLLVDVVVERLRIETRPGPAGVDVACGTEVDVDVEVDIEWGVVHGVDPSGDRRWSAELAPLAARLAGIPPTGWSIVVDREIERWTRVAWAVGQATGPVVPGQTDAAILIRLTTTSGPPGRTLQPAFGAVAWELVRDLGPDGLAAVTPAWSDHGVAAGKRWDRLAARTVADHEGRWASLRLDDHLGSILSGPHVSALLHDPQRLRGRLGEVGRSEPLRVSVFTNSLLLVTGAAGMTGPAIERLADSLRRFATDDRRLFDPFTVEFGNSGAATNTVTPM